MRVERIRSGAIPAELSCAVRYTDHPHPPRSRQVVIHELPRSAIPPQHRSAIHLDITDRTCGGVPCMLLVRCRDDSNHPVPSLPQVPAGPRYSTSMLPLHHQP